MREGGGGAPGDDSEEHRERGEGGFPDPEAPESFPSDETETCLHAKRRALYCSLDASSMLSLAYRVGWGGNLAC